MGMVIYEVYCGERFIGCYKAPTAKKAIEQAVGTENLGNAEHLYKAKEIYRFDNC
jgi:hypothetical protein